MTHTHTQRIALSIMRQINAFSFLISISKHLKWRTINYKKDDDRERKMRRWWRRNQNSSSHSPNQIFRIWWSIPVNEKNGSSMFIVYHSHLSDSDYRCHFIFVNSIEIFGQTRATFCFDAPLSFVRICFISIRGKRFIDVLTNHHQPMAIGISKMASNIQHPIGYQRFLFDYYFCWSIFVFILFIRR